MKIELMLCAAFVATPFVPAQEDKSAPVMPNPKAAAHEALAMFVGNWTSTGKMAALPDMPGFEAAQDTTGTEHSEIVCDGLWLKTTFQGTDKNGTCEGLWLVGYDPHQAKYRGIWVSGMDEPSMECDGSYDAAKQVWTFTGESPMGPFRSVVTFADADHFTEVVYAAVEGKDTECMRMERTRSKAAAVPGTKLVPASATTAKPSAQHALLAAGIGDWNVTSKSMVPGQPVVEEKCSEHVAPICSGKWFWSDFTGSMMGQPYEGHSLTGYDEATKQYVSFWIDSRSATHARTAGTYDPATQRWTFAGECADSACKPAKIHQTYTQKDADARDLQMTFETVDGKHEMRLHYVRKPK
jgi:hypothetical protein